MAKQRWTSVASFLLLSAWSTSGKNEQESLICALQCVSSQGFLRSTRHVKLQTVLTATTTKVASLGSIAWEIEDAAQGGWVWIRSVNTRWYVSMIAPPDKPSWMLTSLPKPTKSSLFRLEHLNGGWFIFSNHSGGYVNCLEGGLIRGHGYYPRNDLAATREPTTEFQLVSLNNSQVWESLRNPLAGDLEAVPLAESRVAIAAKRGKFSVDVLGGRSNDVDISGSPVCRNHCKVRYDDLLGYPTSAFSGPLAKFLCPSMFRDLADYVFKWPFSHFKEASSTVAPEIAAKCLPEVPIIYSHASSQDAFFAWSKASLRRPYILLTGQSDWAPSRSKAILSDPHLVKWFAQNADLNHPKLEAIPIGLNCFEHAPEMHQALQDLKTVDLPRVKLVLVNFGNTHPSRAAVWDHFCGKGKTINFVTCSVKSQQNNVRGNPHLVSYYKKMATHKFVVAPRGNGWDTHRLWEALYLGCVPIVESSVLDPLYSKLPILIVKRWADLDEAALNKAFDHMKTRGPVSPTSLLYRDHWRSVIEAARTDKARALGETAANSSRHRCWG